MAAARILRSSSAAPSVFASPSPLATSLARPRHLQHTLFPRRTMSSAPAKTEWLAVVPDKPNTLAKRLEVRPIHFANLEAPKDAGLLKFGGAILHDTPADPNDAKTFPFAGSTIILLADTKSEVIEFLKKDIYAKEGVWDVDNAQVYALKTAFRLP